MKNIINAFYSRDISQKVSSTIDVKRKTGPFVFGSIPYGYLRDKEDPSRYVIDEEAAPIVHMIFSWAMDGASFSRIAKDLTALGVPTPQRHTWLRSGKKVRRKGADAWSSLTIQFIVTNRAYTGDFVCTKARLRKYDPSDNRRYGPEDWTVYPDNHPAYISKEDFELLQDHILPAHYHQMSRKVPDANDAVSVPDATCQEPLRGILYCGLCGRRMVPIQTIRSDGSIYFRYRCKGEANEHRTGHSPFIMEAASLHFAVFWQVNLQIRYAMDTKELYRRFSAEGAALRLKAKRQAEINLLNGKIAACKQKRTRAFEDLSEGYLDGKTYQALRDKLSDELEDLKNRLAACRERMGNVDTYFTPDNRWLKAFTATGQLDLSDPEALKALVKKVEIFPDDRIRITYQYGDWMEPFLDLLSEAEEWKENRNLEGLPAPAIEERSRALAPASTFVHSELKLAAVTEAAT